MTTPQKMFEEIEHELIFELIYDPDKNIMPAKDLAEAIEGMATCMAVVGRVTKLDFETIYVFPPEHGSIKIKLGFNKREQRVIYLAVVSGALANVVSQTFIGAFSLIGQYGLPNLKTPPAEVLQQASKEIIAICTNADFRRSVPKIARPLNELNQSVTIKADDKSYTIDCNSQYKFTAEDEEAILPDLIDGSTVTITGRLTRINLDQNDLGFEYHGRKLSIFPLDRDKAVGKEFHEFLENPIVTITGVVFRDNYFVIPKIGVEKMEEYKPTQNKLFDEK